ncbi:hypothetical protein HDU96_006028 [Phlyctochytrium bullatum]|nr:hypothetical protein HDU96_006028 [Phlyctochytrium bullatum]
MSSDQRPKTSRGRHSHQNHSEGPGAGFHRSFGGESRHRKENSTSFDSRNWGHAGAVNGEVVCVDEDDEEERNGGEVQAMHRDGRGGQRLVYQPDPTEFVDEMQTDLQDQPYGPQLDPTFVRHRWDAHGSAYSTAEAMHGAQGRYTLEQQQEVTDRFVSNLEQHGLLGTTNHAGGAHWVEVEHHSPSGIVGQAKKRAREASPTSSATIPVEVTPNKTYPDRHLDRTPVIRGTEIKTIRREPSPTYLTSYPFDMRDMNSSLNSLDGDRRLLVPRHKSPSPPPPPPPPPPDPERVVKRRRSTTEQDVKLHIYPRTSSLAPSKSTPHLATTFRIPTAAASTFFTADTSSSVRGQAGSVGSVSLAEELEDQILEEGDSAPLQPNTSSPSETKTPVRTVLVKPRNGESTLEAGGDDNKGGEGKGLSIVGASKNQSHSRVAKPSVAASAEEGVNRTELVRVFGRYTGPNPFDYEKDCWIRTRRDAVLIHFKNREFRLGSPKFLLIKRPSYHILKVDGMLELVHLDNGTTNRGAEIRKRMVCFCVGKEELLASYLDKSSLTVPLEGLAEDTEFVELCKDLDLDFSLGHDTIVVPSPDTSKVKKKQQQQQQIYSDPSIFLVYPATGRNAVTIYNEDLERLQENEFLNDNIMEFFFKYLTNFLFSDKTDQFHIFGTFFFHQLVGKEEKKDRRDRTVTINYEKVQRATKDVDIFKKRFLIIPINENLHWYLAVVVNAAAFLEGSSPDEQGYLLIFDSLNNKHPNVGKVLYEYLRMEAKEKHNKTLNIGSLQANYPKIQHQNNFSDCGIFVLHYAHTMLRNPDYFMSQAVKKAKMDTPEFGTLGEIRSRRHSIRALLEEEREKCIRAKAKEAEEAEKAKKEQAAEAAKN